MKKKKFNESLHFYAWSINFNTDSFEMTNVLGHSYIQKWLNEYLSKEYTDFELFFVELDARLRCEYSGRREYEFKAGDLSDSSEIYKVSVYDQIKPNMYHIAVHIIEEWNKHKRKENKLKIEV